jgi:hypothetical protein
MTGTGHTTLAMVEPLSACASTSSLRRVFAVSLPPRGRTQRRMSVVDQRGSPAIMAFVVRYHSRKVECHPCTRIAQWVSRILTVDDFPMSWASECLCWCCGLGRTGDRRGRRHSLRHAIEEKWFVCISLARSTSFLLVCSSTIIITLYCGRSFRSSSIHPVVS